MNAIHGAIVAALLVPAAAGAADTGAARAVADAVFADDCWAAREGFRADEPIKTWDIEVTAGYEGASTETVTIFQVPCDAGAYNTIDVWMLALPDGAPQPIAFATPTFDIDYADDSEQKVERTEVNGFAATLRLINSSFDPEQRTITSYSKWRGLGDAYDSGTWRLEYDRFVLTGYEVDPTYDGEQTPITVFPTD